MDIFDLNLFDLKARSVAKFILLIGGNCPGENHYVFFEEDFNRNHTIDIYDPWYFSFNKDSEKIVEEVLEEKEHPFAIIRRNEEYEGIHHIKFSYPNSMIGTKKGVFKVTKDHDTISISKGEVHEITHILLNANMVHKTVLEYYNLLDDFMDTDDYTFLEDAIALIYKTYLKFLNENTLNMKMMMRVIINTICDVYLVDKGICDRDLDNVFKR